MKDTELRELLGVPTRTLQDWKNKEKENWRYKVYKLLKALSKEDIAKLLQEKENPTELKKD